jgi:outer membrane receptor protein involved in Fe transport
VGTTAESEVQIDDAVKSERSHSFDVGAVQQVGEHVQVGLDSYAKLVKNLLDEGQFGSALIFTPLNYREGRVYGLEGTVSYTDKNTTAYANAALSRAMGKDIISSQFALGQDELNYISGHWVHLDHDQLLTMSAGIAQSLDELTRVSLDSILGSGLRKGFANTEHMPIYLQLDLGITRHIPIDSDGIDVRASVLNLLDRSYQINDGTGISTAAAHWGPRRTVYLAMTRKF